MSDCPTPPGQVRPIIDRNRCAAEGDCVRVCPYQVFAIGRLSADQRRALSLTGRIKTFVHRGRQAMTPNADACQACGRCVDACPEDAISLIGFPPG